MTEEKSIHQRITEKRGKLIGIHAMLAVHLAKDLTPAQKAKGLELEDRLHYRTLVAEDALLDEKLAIYQSLLDVLRQ